LIASKTSAIRTLPITVLCIILFRARPRTRRSSSPVRWPDGTEFSVGLPRAMDSEVRYGFSVVPEARAPVLPGLGAALLASACRRRGR